MATKLIFTQEVNSELIDLLVDLPDGRSLKWGRDGSIPGGTNGYQVFCTSFDSKVEVLEGEIDFELEGNVESKGLLPPRLSYIALRNGKVLVKEGEDEHVYGNRWKTSIYEVIDGYSTLLEKEEFTREYDGIRVKKTLYSFIPNKED